MEKIIHICFSESAGGTFRHAIKTNILSNEQKVIVFSDNLSQGSVKGEVNIEERIKWCNILDAENYFNDYDAEDLKEIYNEFHGEISKIDNSCTLYFWYGSSREFCGMLYTLELLKGRELNIYLINVADTFIKYNQNVFLARDTGEISPEKIEKYIGSKRKLDSNEYKELLDTWELLKKDNSILRIFKDGKVSSVDESYFDIDILKYTPKEFRKSARPIGEVLGNSEVKILDDYILWRVKELIKSGKIEYSGKLGIMREMEIKITEEGLEYLSSDQKAMRIWEDNKRSSEHRERMISSYREQGRLEEKINIAKKLKDVLDIETIAEKTGLTVGQVEELENYD
jgi:DNA-binding Lrp family transcriptional regulator